MLSRGGALLVAVSLFLLPPDSAGAEQPVCAKASGSLSQLSCEAAVALGGEARGALVVAAPLSTDLKPRDAERLVSRTASLLAGALGEGARFEPTPLGLLEARARARSSRATRLVYVSLRLSRDHLELEADLYAVGGKFWERVKNPSSGPRAHAFSSKPLDAEVRSYLPPVPLIATERLKVSGVDADVVALACGDTDGDGSSELVVVGRRRVAVGRVRDGKLAVERSAEWSALSPVAPAPFREPIATASIVRPDVIDVGSTDRAEAVRLNAALQKVSALGRSLPWPGSGGCARVDTLLLGDEVSACGNELRGKPSADAIAGAEITRPDGAVTRIRAARDANDGSVTLLDQNGQSARLPSAGAQLAVADLDGDGSVELLSSLDTLEPKEDALLAHSWGKAGLTPKLREPVPEGIRAIAVCPFADAGIAPIVVATGEGLWILR